mmetsp:Transcript_5241/g.9624  ORF Transcript_5241/g.9624 Transcript_5241/m.9624 type:complete len:140 (+) Transcript_5241:1626-2045(+)
MKRIFNKLRDLKNRLEDVNLGRKLVGEDMLGNRYYQYFDETEQATKREVEYKKGYQYIETDPLWQRWLLGIDKEAPTPEEVETFKQNFYARVQTAKDWDRQDEAMMKEWRETLKQVRPERSNKEFKPEDWKPTGSGKKY